MVAKKIKQGLDSNGEFEHNGAQFYVTETDGKSIAMRSQLLRSVGVACSDARMFEVPNYAKVLVYPTAGNKALLGLNADAWPLISTAKQAALAKIRLGVAADCWLVPKMGLNGMLFG
jgi:hypothetical protein